MFQTPFLFIGRIRRLEYILTKLICYGAAALLVIFLRAIFGDLEQPLPNVLLLLGFIPLLWFMLAQGIKRCHDRGKSGWWLLVPFYGALMMFADGDYGNNEYGPNPKGIGNDNDPFV